MSAEAMAHVLRYSQHSGTTYTVLLCIADSVNDQHGYELWMAVPNLAAKSRVSERSTFRALVELEESGWLVRVEERPGKTVRYRLIMDGSRQVQWESQWTPDKVASPDKVAVLPLPNASLTPDTVAPKPNRTQKEPKQSEPDEFDEFWTVYPRKVGKGAARKAWAAAKKKEQGR